MNRHGNTQIVKRINNINTKVSYYLSPYIQFTDAATFAISGYIVCGYIYLHTRALAYQHHAQRNSQYILSIGAFNPANMWVYTDINKGLMALGCALQRGAFIPYLHDLTRSRSIKYHWQRVYKYTIGANVRLAV